MSYDSHSSVPQFGADFNQYMGTLALNYQDFYDIEEKDLDTLYSLLPVEFVVDALCTDERVQHLVDLAFSQFNSSLRVFLSNTIEKEYLNSLIELFEIEKTHIRFHGVTTSDITSDYDFRNDNIVCTCESGVCDHDFLDLNRIQMVA